MNREETIENLRKMITCDLKSLQSCVAQYGTCQDCKYHVEADVYESTLVSALELLSIDAVPVVHGYWEIDEDGNMSCSKCGNAGFGNYCPHCGASMD